MTTDNSRRRSVPSLSALIALWLLIVRGDEGVGPVVPHVTLDEVPVDRNWGNFWETRIEFNLQHDPSTQSQGLGANHLGSSSCKTFLDWPVA